jgi:hypothetical protein
MMKKSRPKAVKAKAAPKSKRKTADTASAVSKPASKPYSPERLAGLKSFKPGESGNPGGRQLGSRNKVCERYYAAVLAAWERHGDAALEWVAANDRMGFLQLVAVLIPRNAKLDVEVAPAPLWQRPEDMNAAQWRYFFGVRLKTDVDPEDLK